MLASHAGRRDTSQIGVPRRRRLHGSVENVTASIIPKAKPNRVALSQSAPAADGLVMIGASAMREATTMVGLLQRRVPNPPGRAIGAVALGITRRIAMQAPIGRDMSWTRTTLHGIDDGSDDTSENESDSDDGSDDTSENESDSDDGSEDEDSDQTGWESGDND